jgi:hypothetical protein
MCPDAVAAGKAIPDRFRYSRNPSKRAPSRAGLQNGQITEVGLEGHREKFSCGQSQQPNRNIGKWNIGRVRINPKKGSSFQLFQPFTIPNNFLCRCSSLTGRIFHDSGRSGKAVSGHQVQKNGQEVHGLFLSVMTYFSHQSERRFK